MTAGNRIPMTAIWKSLAWIVAYCFIVTAAWSQAVTGSISDSTGAVVQGATVIVTNEANGETRQGTSNASGNYTFSELPPAPIRWLSPR